MYVYVYNMYIHIYLHPHIYTQNKIKWDKSKKVNLGNLHIYLLFSVNLKLYTRQTFLKKISPHQTKQC